MTSTIFKLKSKLLYFTTIEKNLSSFLINRLAESYSSDLSLPQTCHACSHVWASVVGWFCCLEYILSPAVYVTRYLHDIHTAAWKSPAQQVLPNLHTPVRMPSATGNKEEPTRKSQNKALVIHPTQSNPPFRITRGLQLLQPSQEDTMVSCKEDTHFPPCSFY